MRKALRPFEWAGRMFGGWECYCGERDGARKVQGGLSIGRVSVVVPGSPIWLRGVIILGEDGELNGRFTARIGAVPKLRRRLQAVAALHWKTCKKRDDVTKHLLLEGVRGSFGG